VERGVGDEKLIKRKLSILELGLKLEKGKVFIM
jgi:hypothetical protein